MSKLQPLPKKKKEKKKIVKIPFPDYFKQGILGNCTMNTTLTGNDIGIPVLVNVEGVCGPFTLRLIRPDVDFLQSLH